MPPKIVLASASPSRLRLLTSAGINPTVVVSGVDEEDSAYSQLSPRELVIALAIVKAHTVKALIDYPALIVGCDSTFEFEGESLGKPGTAANAIARAKDSAVNLGYFTPDIASLIQKRKLKSAMWQRQESTLQICPTKRLKGMLQQVSRSMLLVGLPSMD